MKDLDVAYATRIQRERFTGEQAEGYTAEFRVDKAFLDECCGETTVLMHPLPRDSTPGANDLSTDLGADPRLAIFATLLGVERQLQGPLRDVTWRAPNASGPHDACGHMPSASIGA